MFATSLWNLLVDEVVPLRHAADQPATYIRHVLPDSSPNLVWLWQAGLAAHTSSAWIQLPRFSLCGLLTHKKEYYASGQAQGLIIKLKPWTLGLLKERSACEFTDQTVGLPDGCLPAECSPANLTRLTSIPPALQPYVFWLEPLFETYFSVEAIDHSVIKAIQLIEQSQPGPRIKALAEQMAQCTRQFERRFKAATGLTPKQFVRNVRFERARNSLSLGHSILDVTYACGYFDQTHFTREFRHISGTTPKTFQQNTMSLFY